jgi:hypothetical protein
MRDVHRLWRWHAWSGALAECPKSAETFKLNPDHAIAALFLIAGVKKGGEPDEEATLGPGSIPGADCNHRVGLLGS